MKTNQTQKSEKSQPGGRTMPSKRLTREERITKVGELLWEHRKLGDVCGADFETYAYGYLRRCVDTGYIDCTCYRQIFEYLEI